MAFLHTHGLDFVHVTIKLCSVDTIIPSDLLLKVFVQAACTDTVPPLHVVILPASLGSPSATGTEPVDHLGPYPSISIGIC